MTEKGAPMEKYVPKCSLCGQPFQVGETMLHHYTDVELATADEYGVHGTDKSTLSEERCHVSCSAKPEPKGQRLRISSAGSFSNTTARIVQPDGSEVTITDLIRSISINVVDNDLSTATLTFERVELDVVAVNPDLTDQLT